MVTTSSGALADRAAQMLSDHGAGATIEELLRTDRSALEAARDHVAARLHGAVDDWGATATLTVLNRALAQMPRTDPLDWRVRWSQRIGHRKP